MTSKRTSGLANRLAKMAATDPETDESAPVDPAERSLKVAPAPADSSDDEPDKSEPTETESPEATAPEGEQEDAGPVGDEGEADPTDNATTQDAPKTPDETQTGTERDAPAQTDRNRTEPNQTAKVRASTPHVQVGEDAPGERTDTKTPEHLPESSPGGTVQPALNDVPATPPEATTPPVPRRRKAPAATAIDPTTPTSTTPAPAPLGVTDLPHLRETMDRGRAQRRWVEDNLPKRSERGTFMRLPVHLLDVLDEYCDRRDLPQQDFVAAVLDSYFRDLGALPPLAAGHHPDERFFDDLRRQSRSRDY